MIYCFFQNHILKNHSSLVYRVHIKNNKMKVNWYPLIVKKSFRGTVAISLFLCNVEHA